MKSKVFIQKAIDIAKNHKTLYIMGCFGAPMTEKNKARYTKNHSYNKDATRRAMINGADNETFGFDCVCLIKGILWGWKGDVSKTYGGASYAVNGVPDISADSMITKCSEVSMDFSNIVAGEVVWMKGHIGIYIGDGLVVESTPAWKNCVQITALPSNKNSGYPVRSWTKHGKLPYVDYSDQTVKTEEPKAGEVKATDGARNFLKTLAGTYTVTAVAGLNVRHGAGVTKKKMVAIPKGTKVNCYGYYTSNLGVKWLYIQFIYKNVKYTGFASSNYLKK